MFSVSQVNAHKQNRRQIKAHIHKDKHWNVKIIADKGKERLYVTARKNEVYAYEVECLEMWNRVNLRPKHWKEDEHDFCVVEKPDEQELQHD